MIKQRDHELTPIGEALLADLDISVGEVRAARRMFARSCMDWTHRRPHSAGALPAALTSRFLELGWLSRGTGRSLRPASDYDHRLEGWLTVERPKA